MDKTYDPQSIEQAIYQNWEQAGNFKPQGGKQSYSMVIPPPNVTGTLHMGHGFQHSLMDALTRYHRMLGDNTLWQPGVDHAGIATQMVVERQLGQEGKTRHELGREAFVERTMQWKEKSGGIICEQIRRLGASPDWSRERFTMDKDLSDTVRKVFIQLFEEGIIYRGKRLVNWDPKFHTAISDLEVISEEEQGHMWHFNYPLADGSGHLEIATTRPETLLGDTAVAVHPSDERYQHLVGKMLKLPLTDREIPIIADHYVDPEFGSGCVKITPAHDFNDYEVGKRNNLPMINIMTIDAKINDEAPEKYRGMDRFDARKQVIADMEALGLLVATKDHTLKIPRGDRSGVIIEPYLTDQWYVKTEELAKPAIDAVKNGDIEFVPGNWDKTYFQWMDNIEDWCISRQLWWGHRIPAWYDEQGNFYVGETEEAIRSKHNLADDVQLSQDEDVLDTWFSAALWPFATLGWPNDMKTLETFFPTDVLITGFDIIFFWVARMIMFSLKLTGKIPFKQIYITGLIRDADGQKMSKSKGNVIDPIDLIDGIELEALVEKRTASLMQTHMKEKIAKKTREEFPEGIAAHGTDAVRFTFCALSNNNRNIRFDLQRLTGYRNFCNKLWNASRFVMMNVEGKENGSQGIELSLADQWILSRLQNTINKVHGYFEQYRFDYLAQALYEFVWHEYCDWYLELSKVVLNDDNASEAMKQGTRHTLINVLETVLRLAHPIIPFITEAIWQEVAPLAGIKGNTIMTQAYPQADNNLLNEQAEAAIDWLQQVTLGVRNIRGEMNIAPGKRLQAFLVKGNEADREYFANAKDLLLNIARLDSAQWQEEAALPASATATIKNLEVHIPLAGLIDVEAEAARLDKEIEKLDKDIAKMKGKLGNESFVSKAPEAVVEKEKARLAQAESTRAQLQEQKAKLAQL
jgi:valyl-tRNA synthetase